MRQAGRYLPEYRETRTKAGDFLTLCRTPELACEVTLQPLRRYALDAAIIFSDILVIPDAMGLGLRMVESVGPVFEQPIANRQQIQQLPIPDPEDELGYVMDAVRLTSSELDDSVPLIGFSGSPWTLAVYMIEGQSKTDFRKIKSMCEQHPDDLHTLLMKLTESARTYLTAKANAGANALMIFDTWGGILNTKQYLQFSLEYCSGIIEFLQQSAPKVPVILFTKNGGAWLEEMANSGCDAIGIDWTLNIGDARKRVGDKVALQGNLNPASLKLSNQEIEDQTQAIITAYGHGSGHIFNLGHGITPDIDPDKVNVLINAVHRMSKQFH